MGSLQSSCPSVTALAVLRVSPCSCHTCACQIESGGAEVCPAAWSLGHIVQVQVLVWLEALPCVNRRRPVLTYTWACSCGRAAPKNGSLLWAVVLPCGATGELPCSASPASHLPCGCPLFVLLSIPLSLSLSLSLSSLSLWLPPCLPLPDCLGQAGSAPWAGSLHGNCCDAYLV